MAVTKFPPPPDMGRDNQRLNRWLIEIQSILNAGGTIDPENVGGLLAFEAATTANLAAVNANLAALQGQVTALTATVATNTANIATNTANIATNTANIVTLTARNQVLNGAGAPGAGTGNNGDLYVNNAGGAGTNLYAKIGGVWVAFA